MEKTYPDFYIHNSLKIKLPCLCEGGNCASSPAFYVVMQGTVKKGSCSQSQVLIVFTLWNMFDRQQDKVIWSIYGCVMDLSENLNLVNVNKFAIQFPIFSILGLQKGSHKCSRLLFSPQVCPLCLWSWQWAVTDEGQLRQAPQRQPMAQRGGVPGCQQRTYAQNWLTHRYSALQWSS